jgi:thioredoxin 1
MSVAQTSDASFEQDVLNSDTPVVVDFWAEWCGPCRMIAPALEEISNEMGSKVKIFKLNVDENPETAAKFGVRSIPTLLIFNKGENISNHIGAAPKAALSAWIDKGIQAA